MATGLEPVLQVVNVRDDDKDLVIQKNFQKVERKGILNPPSLKAVTKDVQTAHPIIPLPILSAIL